jgi:hypothetical protein
MANSLASNPIIITGSLATSYKTQTAAGLGTLRTLIVEKVYWANPGTIGDTINIGDPISGLSLLALRCEVAAQSQLIDWTANPKLWQDFEISAVPSGTLYIFTR